MPGSKPSWKGSTSHYKGLITKRDKGLTLKKK
jgi:hypothetical protein